MRSMRTRFLIDDVQNTYFVLDSFEQFRTETAPDFAPYCESLRGGRLIGA